jgi:hypothetical protein
MYSSAMTSQSCEVMDELDALLELLIRLHKRRLRDAVARLFLQRLHEDGKLEPRRAASVCRAR